MNYRSFDDMNKLIRKNIHEIQKNNFDLIVGIPRSGMIPAYLIGLNLNIQTCDVETLLNNTVLSTGSTRKSKNNIKYPHDAKNILLVDDSINNGGSIAKIIERIPNEIKSKVKTLAIYSSSKSRKDIDFFLEYVAVPRVFEWNIFHHEIIAKSCFDIDGVLCVDPSEEENDDGVKYLDFIRNASVLFLPTGKIDTIVTSRLEKYREETESWLFKHGISYRKLVMLNVASKEERQRLGNHAIHKAKIYKESGQDLFIESDRMQAIKIHELTSKPVYCVDTNEMFATGNIVKSLYQSSYYRQSKIFNIVKRFPKPLYNSLRYFYRLVK